MNNLLSLPVKQIFNFHRMLLRPTKMLHRILSLLLLNVTVSVKTAQIPVQGVLPFLWQVSSNRANRGHFYNRCHHSHHQRLWCLHPPQSGQRLLTQRPQCQLHEGNLSACAGGGCLLLFTITPGTLCPILLLISWPDVNLPQNDPSHFEGTSHNCWIRNWVLDLKTPEGLLAHLCDISTWI